MRRAFLVLSAVLAAVTLSTLSAAWAQAQAAEQYDGADGGTREESPAPGGDGPTVSQGSIADDTLSAKDSRRIEADLAEEERLPDYSQVVDNSDKGRFTAPGSKTRSESSAYRGGYAQSGGKGATWRMKIPTTSDYALYAWWPESGGTDAARYEVPVSSSGKKTAMVNQSRDGGDWVKIGVFKLEAGERRIRLTPGGRGPSSVAADALLVVRGETAAPPDDSYPSDGGGTISARGGNTIKERRSVVRSARRWMGTPYRYATCKSSRMSCTCLTKRAWYPNGHRIPLTERGQWRYEPSRTVSKANLHRGDIVFFKEGGSRYFTHVAIYSGNGYIVHASTYFNKVAESKMKYVTGYHGAIRMNVR